LGRVLKLELKKAFCNKIFYLVVGIGLVIAAISAWQMIDKYYLGLEMEANALKVTGPGRNPSYALNMLYNNCLATGFDQSMTALFYTLMPLLVCLAYGWSYFGERKSGYVMNVMIRTHKKSQYLLAKYIAVFLSGGAAAVIPLIANFLVVACFIPAYQPDLFYEIYYSLQSHFLRELFYPHPIIFMCILFAIDFFFGGLMATCCVALTFFVKNKFAVILLPFMCLFGVQYLQDNVWTFLSDVYISPMNFLRGYSVQCVSGTVILMWAVVLLVFTLGTVWGKGARDDVL